MVQVVRVLIIEDQKELAESARRVIRDFFEDSEEIEIDVSIANDFDEGFRRVRDGNSDVVVLDVRRDKTDTVPQDDTAGHDGFLEIMKAKFAPIVFWTALPEKVMDEEKRPLVTVVPKDDYEELPRAIKAAVESRALATINEIEQHVKAVLIEHMWSELAPHWDEYTENDGAANIAQVLLSRLARILDDKREQAAASHPSHRYVYPPVSSRYTPGDILRSEDGAWWVTLTPACDFAQKKVGLVLIARADPLKSNARYRKWENGGSKAAWKELERHVLKANQGRYYYLPAFRDLPDLVVDLENVRAVALDELASMTAVASLVSPFSEALLVQHSQFRGRIGVPDLDIDLVKKRLESTRAAD
mgnify:FL=1